MVMRRAARAIEGFVLDRRSRWICAQAAHQERFDAPRADLVRMRAQLEKILTENIVPFWYPGSIDRANGGYLIHHDMEGRFLGPVNKSLVAQARVLWFFARLCNGPQRSPELESAAAHGFAFLEGSLRDPTFGGYHWGVDPAGRPVQSDKHLYGQAFALYALSEYAIAADEERARSRATELVDLVEQHARDRRHGGYREYLKRDWSLPGADEMGYLGKTALVKTLNTHLHLIEALTRFADLCADRRVDAALNELTYVLGNTVVRKRHGACTDHHREDWSMPRGRPNVVFGHDLETIWFLLEAGERIGLPHFLLLDLHETLFFNAWRYGYDHGRGGFYARGELGRFASGREKIWWVQAEALVCALHLYGLTHRRLYFDVAKKTLEWIVERQVDWARGEWHLRTNRAGVGSGEKAHEQAGAWKDPYHNGRAMLRGIELIDALLTKLPEDGEPRRDT